MRCGGSGIIPGRGILVDDGPFDCPGCEDCPTNAKCPDCHSDTYETYTVTGDETHVDIIRCPYCGYMVEFTP